MQTIIGKWGNSQGVRLPKAILEAANLAENERVDIYVEGGRIVIERAVPRTLDELFEGYRPTEPLEIVDWGDPVGREEL